jgi:hypothetical protein
MATFLHELSTWAEVERVAAMASIKTCIRGGDVADTGPNHDRAAEVWQAHYPKSIRYYAMVDGDKYEAVGYVRLLRLTESEYTLPQMWAADFAKPLCYQAIRDVGRLIKPGVLLVKRSGANSKNVELTVDWPYAYRLQPGSESSWLIVPS